MEIYSRFSSVSESHLAKIHDMPMLNEPLMGLGELENHVV
jgi:hypothetical protein